MKIKLGLLLATTILLQGCIPAAFVAGAAAGGAVLYDNRSVQTMGEDRNTTFRTQSVLGQTPELQGTHISVATFNHVLLMVGQVRSQDQSQIAYNIAVKQKNVKRVYNELEVAPNTSNSQRTKDAWITSKVVSDLVLEKGLHSSQIKVVTENNVVYLMGLITHSQSDIAARVASQVKGVTKVVKIFEYLN